MVNNKKVTIVLIVAVFTVIALMLFFYSSKIEAIWNNPSHFWQLFLDASKLSEVLKLSTITGLLMAVAMVLIDLITLGWKRSGLRRLIINPSGSAKVDWWGFLLTVTKFYEVLHFVFTFGVFYFLAGLFVHFMNVDLGSYIHNVYFQFAVIFLVSDLKGYLAHRFMHIRPLWELHAYHHSADEFNLITANRGHFLETSVHYLFSGLFFALFGAPLYDIFIIGLIVEAYQYLLHSEVNWKLGFIGKYVLISPAAHKLHHSKDSKDYNKNYGTFFIWWDYIFGTYAAPRKIKSIGIDENPYNRVGYFKGQWIGLKRFLRVE